MPYHLNKNSEMAPVWLSHWSSSVVSQLLNRQGDVSAASPTSVAGYLTAQWRNPGDILSVLLLVGPDVIRHAIAQLSGRSITPVAFSFGWVAYAPAALLSSLGGANSAFSFSSLALFCPILAETQSLTLCARV